MKITYTQPKIFTQKNIPRIALKEDSKVAKFIYDEKKNATLEIGIEKKKLITRRKLELLARKIVVFAKQHRIKTFALSLEDFSFPLIRISTPEFSEILAKNFVLANYEFIRYKTPPPDGWNHVEEIVLLGPKNPAVEKAIWRAQIIANEVNNARILSNTPGGDMTPEILAHAAQDASKKLGIKTKILNEEEMKKLGMGGVLGVAQGSKEKPKFIILEYHGKKIGKPIVLVGKGVTFDSGGLNIKTGDGMLEMNMDMSGGAAVIHTICAAARLKIKKYVVGLIPAVENMPSGESFRPGDILKTMSGKTIEVLNTDAEGRIILADALAYAKKYSPRLVVDVATLTGAALVALGQRASALFTRDQKLEKLFRQLGEESGDYVWPLPLWEEYAEDIKGTFGDIANIGKTRYGGAIQGAMFLSEFAKDYPWAHLDIAPRMTSVEGEFLAKGSLGTPVRLLVKLLEKY